MPQLEIPGIVQGLGPNFMLRHRWEAKKKEKQWREFLFPKYAAADEGRARIAMHALLPHF